MSEFSASVQRKLDVPESGDFEAVAFGVARQCAAASDLFVKFVDGHGWLVRKARRGYRRAGWSGDDADLHKAAAGQNEPLA